MTTIKYAAAHVFAFWNGVADPSLLGPGQANMARTWSAACVKSPESGLAPFGGHGRSGGSVVRVFLAYAMISGSVMADVLTASCRTILA